MHITGVTTYHSYNSTFLIFVCMEWARISCNAFLALPVVQVLGVIEWAVLIGYFGFVHSNCARK